MVGRMVLGRAAQAVAVFVGATFLLYAVVALLPGDEIRALYGFARPDPEVLAELRAAYHLDEPFIVRYGRYLSGVLTGDFGPLYARNQFGALLQRGAVNTVITATLPLTLQILAVALAVQLIVGVPLGVWLGRRQQALGVRAITALLVAIVAIPSFVLASAVQVVIQEQFGVDAFARFGWLDVVVPGVVVALLPTALLVRLVQGRTREVLAQDWVSATDAIGLSPRRILWTHAGKQVAVIAATAVAVEIGPMLTALAVVEAVLDVGGLGSAVLTGIRNQQGPLIIGGVTTFIAMGVVATLLADVAALLLDPRQSRPLR